uniref:Sushi domain-containing protein n=1 Tax=Cyanistes caeruleus TaxID=156563 RepID=A0A8C0VR81_CYACU
PWLLLEISLVIYCCHTAVNITNSMGFFTLIRYCRILLKFCFFRIQLQTLSFAYRKKNIPFFLSKRAVLPSGKCTRPLLENGSFYSTEIDFKIHEKLQYKCNPGYHTPSGATEDTVQCQPQGWSFQPSCTKKLDCSSPPVIKNGGVLGPLLASYKNGSWVEYGCQHYHFLDGPSTVYCDHGNWTEPPTCLEPCTLNVTDMDSNNLTLKWRREELIFLHGDLIEFECKQGYGFLQTAIPSPGRTQCDHGRLKYPKCVIQGKAIFFFNCIFN